MNTLRILLFIFDWGLATRVDVANNCDLSFFQLFIKANSSDFQLTEEINIMPYSLEQKFHALCQITRASHFEWRQTFIEMNPDADPKDAVLKYWEIVGHDTAKAYIKQIDPEKPIIPQLAKAIVDSSLAMGEAARIIPGDNDKELHFEHLDCPWLKWHQRYDAVDEDRPGCDKWLETLINDISEEFDVKLEFETLSSLPDGQESCKRVLRQVE